MANASYSYEMSCLTLFFLVVQRDHAKHNRPQYCEGFENTIIGGFDLGF
jgi:hypothetical protein